MEENHDVGSSLLQDNPSVTEVLAAHNMRRLLDAYRTLAPLTIGGPASTSLENMNGQLNPGVRIVQDQTSLRRLQQFPWFLGPAPGRRRHSSCGGVNSIPPPPLSPTHPILSPRDRESSSLLETCLEGRGISCFSVGGELRLCLTQVLQLVLSSVPLHRIHQACEELQIYCSTSSPAQLSSLKLSRVLPVSTTQCGLITKSDAERLCSLLLHSSSPSTPSSGSPAASPPRSTDPTLLRVQHNCFGTCVGVLHPKSFLTPDSPSIECSECRELFSPPKFVCHSHRAPDRGIVHWGFSRENWTTYIQVWDEYTGKERESAEIILNNFKQKFNNTTKRKLVEPIEDEAWSKKWKDTEQTSPTRVQALPNLPPANLNIEKVGYNPDHRIIFPWNFISPNPYLQSLAQIQGLRLLLDQQNHQQNLPLHPLQSLQAPNRNQLQYILQQKSIVENEAVVRRQNQEGGRDCEEFMVGVAAVLAGAGVEEHSRLEVLNVVERLVDRLQRAEQDKVSASNRLKGMEERVSRLEKELAKQLVQTGDSLLQSQSKQEDETSSDGGIESGTEADDFSEK